MEHTYSFEKLEAWKYAKNLAVEMYKLTQTFPDSEKFGMVSQIRRSASSVPANIAEGSARLTTKSQSNFYQIAYSSLLELYNHLIIADDLNYFSLNIGTKEEIFRLTRIINGLYKKSKEG